MALQLVATRYKTIFGHDSAAGAADKVGIPCSRTTKPTNPWQSRLKVLLLAPSTYLTYALLCHPSNHSPGLSTNSSGADTAASPINYTQGHVPRLTVYACGLCNQSSAAHSSCVLPSSYSSQSSFSGSCLRK
eukprot:GHUV01050699.1.p1 GENE.GHUV01050699.1~~GHUV01050699.1.p1  ORF type:complete len:132 (-),score=6.79 GHUV01050699.1:256-651(-)